MRDIDKLFQEIIPPSDYQHRNGFSNEQIILSLDNDEKMHIERKLINMLESTDDTLIGETLAILKSYNSLPILRNKLDSTKKADLKIIWASYIFEISQDDEMKSIALNEFDNVSEKYTRISLFHYLAIFNDPGINEKVKNYINHDDYLTAYNARTSLGIDTKVIVERERRKDRIKRWSFWER
jgi:hypothetical protein